MLFGTFDGVHVGHAWLIQNAKFKMQNVYGPGAKLYIVVGRDKTVSGVKGRGPRQSERERMAAIRALFPECTVVLGHKTNRMYWLRKVRPDVVFLGYDQTFFVKELRRQIRSFYSLTDNRQQTRIIRLKPFNEGVYKSSKIKKPHLLVRGVVVHGKKFARSVGYPTANIRLNGKLKKVVTSSGASGIYASRALLAVPGRAVRSYLAATVVGARTHERAPLVETHLIGYRGDCYSATITISLERKLRNFKTYTTTEALKNDIEKDVAAVTEYFALH